MNAALINYHLHKALEAGAPAEKIAKYRARLEVAKRRELKQLAKVLTFKADIYGPNGRIYSADAKWTVRDGKLLHGETEYAQNQLWDGHGRMIITDAD